MADVTIAPNRFGIGARPDEPLPKDAKAWLRGQIHSYRPAPPPIEAAPGRRQVSLDLLAYYALQRGVRQQAKMAQAVPIVGTAPQPPAMEMRPIAPAPAKPEATMASGAPSATATGKPNPSDAAQAVMEQARKQRQLYYTDAIGTRTAVALTTPAPFVERLVYFWANHFAVSADKEDVTALAGTLEFEAIRPHVLGKFGDMLHAVERHPAMLLYLDQAQSVGPTSQIGAGAARRGNARVGLNENLAREIMELHTLGVRSGYSQTDVTEFARAMTGWTVAGIGRGPGARFVDALAPAGEFVFAERAHEPGVRTILGRSYAEPGEAQANAVLGDLAVHPATATHIATKLARHFAGDTPPPALIARLQAGFATSGGDLPTVYRVLIDAPEMWTPAPAKFKTPWEWSISAYRAMGLKSVQSQAVTGLLTQLGQPIWKPGSPAGYDDLAGSWAGPDAVLRRVEAAQRFAGREGRTIDARALAPRLFPDAVGTATAQALARAESASQALALLLVAPEFMRR